MGAVVWDTTLDSTMPARSTFSEYTKLGHGIVPGSTSPQQHHHFTYPGSFYHTLSNVAPSFRHHKGDELSSWTPDCDIRDSKTAYHIDIEVPGVSDKKSIRIVWLLPNVLQIEATAARPHVKGDDSGAVSGSGTNGIAGVEKIHKKDAHGDGYSQDYADRKNEREATYLVHGERKIGSWQRLFTIPEGCDVTTLKARLDAGLLQISVSRKEGAVAEDAEMVEIE